MSVDALKLRGAEGASNKGVPEMCDYSLQTVKSRPAKVGDKLTTRDFGTCTRGFAAAEDAAVAVCVLPGTELAFSTAPPSSAKSTRANRSSIMMRLNFRLGALFS